MWNKCAITLCFISGDPTGATSCVRISSSSRSGVVSTRRLVESFLSEYLELEPGDAADLPCLTNNISVHKIKKHIRKHKVYKFRGKIITVFLWSPQEYL